MKKKNQLKISNNVVILFRFPLAASTCDTVTIVFLVENEADPILVSGV